MRQAGYAGVSRREWLSRFTAREYAELIAFRRLEPVGFERLDYYYGEILAAIKNLWGTPDGEEPITGESQRFFFKTEADAKQKAADRADVEAAKLVHFMRMEEARQKALNANGNIH